MFEIHSALFLWTETPLHAGSGSTVGVIDLPIQRDRQTQHPIVQASGVKGALRDHCRQVWGVGKASMAEADAAAEEPQNAGNSSSDTGKPIAEQEWEAIFGPLKGDLFGGAVSFTEARLVLFPVRSLCGVCAWITCPMALARLKRDLERAGIISLPPLPNDPGAMKAWVMSKSPLILRSADDMGNVIVLEEFALTADTSQDALLAPLAQWLAENAVPSTSGYEYWQERLIGAANNSQMVVLSDNEFTDFVQYATNVDQRIRIDSDTGIVVDGALWIEESLPADSLLYSILHVMSPRESKKQPVPASLCIAGKPSAEKVRDKFLTSLTDPNDLIQLGGDETVGRGLTRLRTLSLTRVKEVSEP